MDIERKYIMKVSVVTVTYNASATLEETMQSVFHQSYPYIEYIIIDGASADGTVNIISKYADKLSYWLSEQDKGIYDAMNKALKVATGDFLIFMGADDLFYTNDVIKNVVSQITDLDAVYYGSVLFKGRGTKHWGQFNKIKWAVTNVSHQAIFYPKVVYTTHSYDIQYRIYADYAYNLNLLAEKVCFIYVDEIIALYDMTGISANAHDEIFQRDFRGLVFSSVGGLAYYIGKCIRNLYFIKESLKSTYNKKRLENKE